MVVESEKKKGRRRMALGDLVLCMQRSVESMTSAFLGSSAGAGATTGQQHLSSLLPQQHMEEKQEKEEQEKKQLVMLQEWREQDEEEEEDTVASSSVPDFPHNLYLSDLRHDGVAITSAGPLENGVVSKWRMKDRVRDTPLFSHLSIVCFVVAAMNCSRDELFLQFLRH